jgi:RNA polymerase sigma-70 factor (ECF subfamily)
VLVGRLFAEHGRMVLGLCRLLLRDPIEAEDAAQQVFLSAHRAMLGGAVPREAAAWLAAIARNECRLRIRARMREPLALPELPSDLPDPLASAIRAVDLDAVWTAISSLPRRQRRALVLRELGGLSYHELGRALGVSHSSVESLLFRARRHVRSLLAGTNAAALPLALRDELVRLIPGFDPGSVGLVARAAALPIGVKLATAAVGVGVVTTGAAQIREHSVRLVHPQAVVAAAPVERPAPVFQRPQTVQASDQRSFPPRVVHEPTRQQRDRAGDVGRELEQHQRAEPAQVEPAQVEHAQVEPAQVEPADVEPSQTGLDSSGSGGSGSPGGDSQPGGSSD